MPGAGASAFDLTKLDVAAAEIRTAVRLFFEDSHPVPIYVLASSAREILTTIGGKLGINTTAHDLADAKAVSLKAVIRRAHKFASFFKHADKDPAARIHFDETEVAGSFRSIRRNNTDIGTLRKTYVVSPRITSSSAKAIATTGAII